MTEEEKKLAAAKAEEEAKAAEDKKDKEGKLTIEMLGVDDDNGTKTTDAMEAMAKQIKALQTENLVLKTDRESDKKKVILEKLKDAGYDIKLFESLSLEALEASALALSNTDKELIIPTKREDEDFDPLAITESEVLDVKTGKMVKFSERTR